MENEVYILIADDDATNLDIIEEFLEPDGYQIITALNGREALDILQDPPGEIKVVILDWMMPEMDGMEVLEWMKSQSKYEKIPVIIQTAKSYTEDMMIGIEKGAFQYLTKPFEDELLRVMVRAAIDEYNRFIKVERNADEMLQSIKNSGQKMLKRTRKALNKVEFDYKTQLLINEYFIEILLSHNVNELTEILMNTVKKLEFSSADKQNLRCSILLSGEMDVEMSDRGVTSKMDGMVLHQALHSGEIYQGGKFTAIPSKNKRTAILIRNTPSDPEERDQALDIISLLFTQFEARLTHLEQEDRLNETQNALNKKNEQMQILIEACYREIEDSNPSDSNFMGELEQIRQILKTHSLEKNGENPTLESEEALDSAIQKLGKLNE